MQKIRSNIKIVAVASDVIVLAYFVMNLFWLFVELGDTNPIKYFFVYIANPMTVGAY